MEQSLSRLCYCDLYIIGRLWLDALRSVLVGANIALIPTVYAAAPPAEPKYPPVMRYKDLPLYQSPHYDYKDHVADKEKCPKAHTPMLQEYLLPSVKSFRRDTQKSLCQIGCGFSNAWRQLKMELADYERGFKRYMRDPDNYTVRVTTVVLGSVSGFYLSRRRGLPTRIFGTTLGGLLAGSVSFPDESDRGFREILYRGGKALIAVYNMICSDDYALEERLSCREDMPPDPPPRKPQCPMK